MSNKPQEFSCSSCGHKWIGSQSTCPNCDGIAKSQGEFTKKTLQGDSDLKKAF